MMFRPLLTATLLLISCTTFSQINPFDAVENDDYASLQQYLSEGESIDAMDTKSASGELLEITLLQWAVILERDTAVNILLNNRELSQDKQAFLNMGLAAAVSTENPEYVREFIELGADVNINCGICHNAPLLMVAYANHQKDIADQLIQAGANVNIGGEDDITLLQRAVENHDIEMVVKILKHGGEPDFHDQYQQTASMWAIHYGDTAIYSLLIENGAQTDVFNESGDGILEYAVNAKESAGLEYLIKSGFIVPGFDEPVNMLESAIILQDQRLFETLIKAGADPNALTPTGRPVLSLAYFHCHDKMIKALIKAGANIHAIDPTNGRNALHTAAYMNCMRNARYLISKGINVNALTKRGFTALHLLIKSGNVNEEDYQILLKAGADPQIKDADGKSAVDYVRDVGLQEILLLFEN